jgi:hypothetical protein
MLRRRVCPKPKLIRAGINLLLERKVEKPDWGRLAASFSGSWAQRENLDEEMRAVRRRWNRRDQLMARSRKRS